MKNKLVFISSHPIQYFAPLYAYLSKENKNVEAWYLTDETLKGSIDKEFGVPVKWDFPILEGYKYQFFKNNSFKKGIHKGFFGLVNLGIPKALKKSEKLTVIIPGWQFFSYLLTLFAAKYYGHVTCLRIETPNCHKLIMTGIKQKIKNFILKHFVFKYVDRFLYIGLENKKYYESFNIPHSKLIYTPYAVDNEKFQITAQKLLPLKNELKEKLGIPNDKFVILYSGKYISKKNPLHLLKAISVLENKDDYFIIFLGDGALRNTMEEYAINNKLTNILFTGFKNQSEIGAYYAVSNVFVMCSGLGETWGLSTNEALNFGLPIVLSNLTGCSSDLVIEGVNGYVFNTGDIHGLAQKLAICYKQFNTPNEIVCPQSISLINQYSFATINNNLSTL